MKWPRGKALACTLALFSVAGFGAAYLLFSAPEAPAPVRLSSPKDQGPAASRSEEFDPVGRWAVREGSEAGYRVREKLASLSAPSDAVGRTGKVTGDFLVSNNGRGYTVSGIRVEVDMTSLTSDRPRRDNALRERGLETDRFPTATFVSPGPLEVPEDIRLGDPVDFMLDGALTIHGVTRQVSIPVKAHLTSRTLEVVGSLTLPMADFGIEPPNVADIVSVEPTGTMEFRLLLERVV